MTACFFNISSVKCKDTIGIYGISSRSMYSNISITSIYFSTVFGINAGIYVFKGTLTIGQINIY